MARAFGKFWKEVSGIILKHPVVLFSVCMAYVSGYGMSFLLFNYRRNPREVSHWMHLAVGAGYTALIFVVMNWSLVFDSLSLEDLTLRSPQTVVVSLALFFIVLCVVTIMRERRSKG